MPQPSGMTFAVIPSKLDRLSLIPAANAIEPQVDEMILVESVGRREVTDPQWSPYEAALEPTLNKFNHMITYPDRDLFNISRAWNLGLEAAATRAANTNQKEWWVAVINDDATPPKNWFAAVVKSMKDYGADVGCSGSPTGHVLHHVSTTIKPYPVHDRMTGWAFVVRGSADLWFDEEMVWWFGDDDFMYRAANKGGHVRIPGFEVPNLHANGHMTPERHVQSGVDRGTFVRKNGFEPW